MQSPLLYQIGQRLQDPAIRRIENEYAVQSIAERSEETVRLARQIRDTGLAELSVSVRNADYSREQLEQSNYTMTELTETMDRLNEENARIAEEFNGAINDLANTLADHLTDLSTRVEQSAIRIITEMRSISETYCQHFINICDQIVRMHDTMQVIDRKISNPHDTKANELRTRARTIMAHAMEDSSEEQHKNLQDALGLFKQCLKNPIGKLDPLTQFDLGWLEWKVNKDYTKAKEHFETAGRLARNNRIPGELQTRITQHIAHMHYLLEDYEEAEKTINHLKGTDPLIDIELFRYRFLNAPNIWVPDYSSESMCGDSISYEFEVKASIVNELEVFLNEHPELSHLIFNDPDFQSPIFEYFDKKATIEKELTRRAYRAQMKLLCEKHNKTVEWIRNDLHVFFVQLNLKEAFKEDLLSKIVLRELDLNKLSLPKKLTFDQIHSSQFPVPPECTKAQQIFFRSLEKVITECWKRRSRRCKTLTEDSTAHWRLCFLETHVRKNTDDTGKMRLVEPRFFEFCGTYTDSQEQIAPVQRKKIADLKSAGIRFVLDPDLADLMNLEYSRFHFERVSDLEAEHLQMRIEKKTHLKSAGINFVWDPCMFNAKNHECTPFPIDDLPKTMNLFEKLMDKEKRSRELYEILLEPFVGRYVFVSDGKPGVFSPEVLTKTKLQYTQLQTVLKIINKLSQYKFLSYE